MITDLLAPNVRAKLEDLRYTLRSQYNPSREFSVALTKLDEFELWLCKTAEQGYQLDEMTAAERAAVSAWLKGDKTAQDAQ
jgi:hypothetical protein